MPVCMHADYLLHGLSHQALISQESEAATVSVRAGLLVNTGAPVLLTVRMIACMCCGWHFGKQASHRSDMAAANAIIATLTTEKV